MKHLFGSKSLSNRQWRSPIFRICLSSIDHPHLAQLAASLHLCTRIWLKKHPDWRCKIYHLQCYYWYLSSSFAFELFGIFLLIIGLCWGFWNLVRRKSFTVLAAFDLQMIWSAFWAFKILPWYYWYLQYYYCDKYLVFPCCHDSFDSSWYRPRPNAAWCSHCYISAPLYII